MKVLLIFCDNYKYPILLLMKFLLNNLNQSNNGILWLKSWKILQFLQQLTPNIWKTFENKEKLSVLCTHMKKLLIYRTTEHNFWIKSTTRNIDHRQNNIKLKKLILSIIKSNFIYNIIK